MKTANLGLATNQRHAKQTQEENLQLIYTRDWKKQSLPVSLTFKILQLGF
jgi:hypothetical protein